MSLLLENANEVGIPDDPEFRSAMIGYLEWGSRLAVVNANYNTIKSAPMPKWRQDETG